ncbi:ATP-binding cassette domain-containing protein [Sulfuracidifex metallicus]|uniref:ATP-binding cassette domain-containing protein n=1 Tax=Sulfuracidifex metallicus TaxID=47303 RepID=UPI002273D00F|nr:ATP-binding cassette domain-containing protein [Sulfuracidifex metallicus]MCY0850381.1 ATP-binding cassette domain-containing protein [Sulfuracidifex metallicus]
MINLNCVTKKSNGRKILDSVSFTVDEGEIVAIVGPKGSEIKSLAGVIAGISKVDSGSITIDGFDINDTKNVLRNTCLIPRKLKINDTTLEKVFYRIGRRNHIRSDIIEKREKELFTLLGIEEMKNKVVKELSRSARIRFLISLAILKNPNNIILYNIQNGLDEEDEVFLKEIILEWANDGKSILLLSSDIGWAREVADRIMFMKMGKIVEELEILPLLLHKKSMSIGI